tara:strand:- start:152 stop:439 length:288 start_codon:yes stop_codon:yes gene_type:complete
VYFLTRLKKRKQAKLGQFSTYQIKTGQVVHHNYTYNVIKPFDCMVLSSNHFKKREFLLKFIAWSNMARSNFTVYHIPLAVLTQWECKLDQHLKHD